MLDIRTIVVSTVLITAICTLVIGSLWRQSRGRFAGIGYFLIDFAAQTLAAVLIASRGHIPDWMSIVVSNTAVIGGAIVGYVGLERYLGKRSAQHHNVLLLAVFAGVHAYFAVVQPDLAMRTLNVSMALLVVSAQCVWLLSRRIDPAVRHRTRIVRMVFAVLCSVSVVRIAKEIHHASAVNDFFQRGVFDASVLLAYQIAFVLLTFGLVMMVNLRLIDAVKTQDEKFTKAFRSAPYAILLTRMSDGRIEEINEGFARIFGCQYDEAIGKTTLALGLWHSEEDRAAVIAALSAKEVVRAREMQFCKRSGEIFWGSLSAENFFVDGRSLVLSSIEDISERKQAEVELLHARKLEGIGQLAAGIAHEINTPTQFVGDNLRFLATAIKDVCLVLGSYEKLRVAVRDGVVDTALLEEVDTAVKKSDLEFFLEEAPRAAAQGLEGVERVAKIVGAMKDFAHVGGVEKALVDFNRAIEGTITVCRNEWKYVAQVELELDQSLPLVPCVLDEVNQVVLNLVVNAAHAIGEKREKQQIEVLGRIGIKTSVEEGCAVLGISDDGQGMSPKVRDRIFEPFFTTKPVGKGTGQGLAIVRDIVVKRHGGAIEVESVEGRGTTIKVKLPL